MKHSSDQPEVTETKPTQDEVAKQAYAIYTKEGKPQGHAEQNWLEAEAKLKSGDHMHMDEHDHHGQDHHAHMAADFRKRFWISLGLTLPILALSPMLQKLVGLREAISFSGDTYLYYVIKHAIIATSSSNRGGAWVTAWNHALNATAM
jgi:cation transport ATPase